MFTKFSDKRFSLIQLGLLVSLAACLGAALASDSDSARICLVVLAAALTVIDLASIMHKPESKDESTQSKPERVVYIAQSPTKEPQTNDSSTASPAAIKVDQAAPSVPSIDELLQPGPSQDSASIEVLAPEPAAQTPIPATPNEPDSPQKESTALAPSKLDFSELSHRLTSSNAPIAELKRFVGNIRTREAHEDDDATVPSKLERYAARMLEEAGLFSKDVELPQLTVVRPRSSGMVYLRSQEPSMPYLAKLRIIKLEAALNAIRFAYSSLPADATMRDAYLLNQGLAHSIIAQASPLTEPIDLTDVGPWPEGEWTVRYGISQAIETLQLPYRLVAHYRTNVADGNVAIEIELPPAEVFPSSCYVEGLGIVPSTGDMRQRAAADYALRLALLMAASAFRCSGQIKHVWIAGICETATRRTCYLSVDFDRWRFSRLDLAHIDDLAETYRLFAPVLRYEDGWLRPVKQGFHLEEERFCPKRRYMPVSLSSRRLKGHLAASLGTDHVSGLSIEESDGRTLVANAIMMRLAPKDDHRSTQKNVKTVMDLAGDDPDPSVRAAAERVVRGLVAGTLDEDAFTVGEEFVRGDAITRADDRAKELLVNQKPAEAEAVIAPVLARIDEARTYADTATVAYRYFNSYVERALYNRLEAPADGGKTVMLVPDAYYEAHLLASVAALLQGQHEKALAHALRLVELAPLDARARLHVVKCLEVLERNDEAIEQLCTLLEHAWEPQSLGFGYYRMAYFQWKRGNVNAAHACYQCAMFFLPNAIPMMAMELSVLYLQNPDALEESPSEEQIRETLAAYDIPVAPTEKTSEVFYDCARASLDAEIFPVARNFARVMEVFSGDDVISGVTRSLEDEPDR